MKIVNKTAAFVIGLSLTAFANPVFGAAENKISVQGEVMARLSQTFIQQQTMLTLTQADIDRGYIDIPANTILQVDTNVRSGYFLHIGMRPVVLRGLTVLINGRAVEVPPGGGLVHQAGSKSMRDTLHIGYRLFFTTGITPGAYAWPVSTSASLI
ncbi:MAG: hypothetical protein ACE5GK_08170 [Nitrospiria bacterium]